MNETNDIQLLLDRFMDGATTLEEEARLDEYFRTHDVKPEWQPYKEMFGYFDEGMKDEQPEETVEEPQPKSRKRWLRMAVIATAAAVAVIGILTLPRHFDEAVRHTDSGTSGAQSAMVGKQAKNGDYKHRTAGKEMQETQLAQVRTARNSAKNTAVPQVYPKAVKEAAATVPTVTDSIVLTVQEIQPLKITAVNNQLAYNLQMPENARVIHTLATLELMAEINGAQASVASIDKMIQSCRAQINSLTKPENINIKLPSIYHGHELRSSAAVPLY
jgi:hypothetical protein